MLQTTSSGALFWSGPKRCPHPIDFDADNELHMDFIVAAANLKAFMCTLKPFTDRAAIKDMLAKVEVPEFKPRSGVKIDVTDEEAQARQNDGNFGEFSLLSVYLSQPARNGLSK